MKYSLILPILLYSFSFLTAQHHIQNDTTQTAKVITNIQRSSPPPPPPPLKKMKASV